MRRQISLKHQNHDLNGRVTSFNFAKNPHLQSRQARPFFSAFSSAFLPFFISAAHLKELSPAVRLTLQLFFPSSTSHHTHNTPPLYLSSICRTNKPESSNHIAIKTAIMSSMRNAVQRRNHKERAQPLERQKWGLLEKHKVGLTSLLLAA